MMAPTGTVTSRTVRRYFASRMVPSKGNFDDGGGDDYYTQRRGFADAPRAWLWVARGALFRARIERCYCARVKAEYRGEPAWDGGPGQCRYCDQDKWRPVVARLARIMQHRARKVTDG